MDRPTKHIGNAGDEPFTYEAIVEGQPFTLELEPGEGADVPVDDQELAEIQARAAAPPPPPPLPNPGDVVTQANGSQAIVTAVDAAAGTVDLVTLPAPTTVPASDVNPETGGS